MFELQDSKGNRFAITRGGSRKSSKILSGSGSTLQIRRLLRNCNNLALVRAYSYFFSGTRATVKPLAPNAAKSNNDQTVVFETQTLEANDTGNSGGLPTAIRASAKRFGREHQLFTAIANGELQLTQTYVAQAFDITKAEKALGLSRSRLLSELNAIALYEQTAAKKHGAANPTQPYSTPWGASTSAAIPLANAQIIQQQYRRFVASLPQVLKTESTSAVTAPTGTSEVQSREMIKALGFSPNKVSSSQFQQANQLASAIWRDKGLYKTLTQFSDAYTSAQSPSGSSNKSSATNDATNYELALTLLLCHNQDPHSLSSPSARQIELFPRFKNTGRNLWETAEASRALNAEKLTTAGKNSKASFSDLAAEDAKVREKTTPAPVITYIEIQLLDDKGEPVANEPYWIKDPEGNEHTGSTDGSGKARVDGIRSGSCQVAFPEIEGSGVQQCSAGVDCCTPAEAEDTESGGANETRGATTSAKLGSAGNDNGTVDRTNSSNKKTEQINNKGDAESKTSEPDVTQEEYSIVRVLPEADQKQYVNLDSTASDPTAGQDLPIEAHLDKPIAGVTVYFILEPHADNNKALPPRMQPLGPDVSMMGEQKVLSATTDSNGIASTKIQLGTFGGDQFKVVASLAPQSSTDGSALSSAWITVWRRLWFQLTHHKDLSPPSMVTSISKLKDVFIDFVAEPAVTHNIGKNGDVVIGSHNTAKFHALHRNDNPGRSVHILFCDEQIDGSPNKQVEETKEFATNTGYIEITATGTFIMFDPPLGGGDLIIAATWENLTSGAQGTLTNDPTAISDSIGLCEYFNEDLLKITLPPNAAPSAKDKVIVEVKANLASGPWGGDGGTAPHNLIKIDSDDTIHSMCVMHELGHLMNMGPLATRVKCPEGFEYADHTKIYESNGAHCYSGGKFNLIDNEAENGTCIMFHQLNYNCSLDFCSECTPFIKAMSLKKYKDLAK